MNGVSAVPVAAAVAVALGTAGLSETAIVVFVAFSWTLRSCPHHRLHTHHPTALVARISMHTFLQLYYLIYSIRIELHSMKE